MSSKWFQLNFKNQSKPIYVQANSIQEAFTKAGFNTRALGVFDYYNEVSSIPFDEKPVYIISFKDDTPHELSRDTMLCRQVLPKLKNHYSHDSSIMISTEARICKTIYTILATIYPLKIDLEILCERNIE